MNELYSIKYCGDSALDICFEEKISPEINALVSFFTEELRKKRIHGVIDIIPAYCTVQIFFDPLLTTHRKIEKKILSIKPDGNFSDKKETRTIHIPVCYEGEFAPDIKNVCDHSGLDEKQVIEIHSRQSYLIYMLGFLPGFPYLGGLDERIHTPRLTTPRTRIEPGSVGIGGKQTGIYPVASPGGWQIIGRTPVKVYDKSREEPVLYRAGERIKFDPISREEFLFIERNGDYKCETEIEKI